MCAKVEIALLRNLKPFILISPTVFEAAVVCNVVLYSACLSSYDQSNCLYIGRIE